MISGTARRISANFFSLMGSQVLSRVIQLVIFAYLARALGKDTFGIFNFGLAFSLILVIIADFGLPTLLVREISLNKKLASKYLYNSIMIKVLLSVITFVAAYTFLNIARYPNETKYVAYIMLAFALLQSFTEVVYSLFRAFERMHYDAFTKILRTIMLLIAIFYAIPKGYGVIAASLAFLAVEAIILIISLAIAYTKFVKISFEFDYGFSKILLKKSSLFCLSMVFANLYMYIDVVMLSKMRSNSEVGLYAAATNIIIALIFIPSMYGASIYPVLSRFYVTSKESLRFAYERSIKYMIILGMPIAVGVYFLSENIIVVLYGNEYLASAVALSILSGYLFLKFLNPITGFTLIAIDKQSSRLVGQGAAALINIALNLILIPNYGFVGAAVATLLTEIIFFIIYTSFIVKNGFKLNFAKSFIYKPLIAAVIMIFLLPFINNLFLSIFLGIFIYTAVVLALGVIDKEDKLLFNKIVRNA